MSRLNTRFVLAALVALSAESAVAGAVIDQFRSGAFGLPWNATRATIEAKYPGGQWDQDEHARQRYCAKTQQSLLKLPAQHKTREICFLIGADGPQMFIPDGLPDDSAKDDFATTARLMCVAHGATACVMALEAWAKFATPGEKFDETEKPPEAF